MAASLLLTTSCGKETAEPVAPAVLPPPGGGNTVGSGQFAGLDGSDKYSNYEGVDQAWMQRLQIMLSKYK